MYFHYKKGVHIYTQQSKNPTNTLRDKYKEGNSPRKITSLKLNMNCFLTVHRRKKCLPVLVYQNKHTMSPS